MAPKELILTHVLLQYSLKTQRLPEDWDKENVKQLTGSNFESFVADPNKDVFVVFYTEDSTKVNKKV